MTPTTPASEQERETLPDDVQAQDAHELAVKVVQAIFHLTPDVIPTGWPDEITPLLASALAQARERAEREQMEKCIEIIQSHQFGFCQVSYCEGGPVTPRLLSSGDARRELINAIRAANAERLRESDDEKSTY